MPLRKNTKNFARGPRFRPAKQAVGGKKNIQFFARRLIFIRYSFLLFLQTAGLFSSYPRCFVGAITGTSGAKNLSVGVFRLNNKARKEYFFMVTVGVPVKNSCPTESSHMVSLSSGNPFDTIYARAFQHNRLDRVLGNIRFGSEGVVWRFLKPYEEMNHEKPQKGIGVIYRAVIPFVILQLVCLFLVAVFPDMVLWITRI